MAARPRTGGLIAADSGPGRRARFPAVTTVVRLKLLLTWFALPIYLWQGAGVRLKTERLLPPAGVSSGQTAGKGEPVRLLILGDSSAVGIGVQSTDQNLAGHLVPMLAKSTGKPVAWRAAGFNSATSGQVLHHVVPNLQREPWTWIVLSIGTNDVKNLHTLRRFKRDFGGLVYALNARFPGSRIIWSPPVDMRCVPALPRPLADIMETRAAGFIRLAERLCAERGALAAPRLPITDPAGFSSDGFHAGALGYRAWAEHLLGLMTDETT